MLSMPILNNDGGIHRGTLWQSWRVSENRQKQKQTVRNPSPPEGETTTAWPAGAGSAKGGRRLKGGASPERKGCQGRQFRSAKVKCQDLTLKRRRTFLAVCY